MKETTRQLLARALDAIEATVGVFFEPAPLFFALLPMRSVNNRIRGNA